MEHNRFNKENVHQVVKQNYMLFIFVALMCGLYSQFSVPPNVDRYSFLTDYLSDIRYTLYIIYIGCCVLIILRYLMFDAKFRVE